MMKHILIVLAFVGAALFSGCSTAKHRAVGDQAATAVAIRLTSLLGMEGSYHDARIYVDGRFVGNYEPDETVFALSAGRHVVRVDVPRVYSRRQFPDGKVEMWAYSLRGEESIEVLGSGSKQSLVFNAENLKAKQIKETNGR